MLGGEEVRRCSTREKSYTQQATKRVLCQQEACMFRWENAWTGGLINICLNWPGPSNLKHWSLCKTYSNILSVSLFQRVLKSF